MSLVELSFFLLFFFILVIFKELGNSTVKFLLFYFVLVLPSTLENLVFKQNLRNFATLMKLCSSERESFIFVVTGVCDILFLLTLSKRA